MPMVTVSEDGGVFIVCPGCRRTEGETKIRPPYPPDREEKFGYVTLRCMMCGEKWKAQLRFQKDGQTFVLEWKDGLGPRYFRR